MDWLIALLVIALVVVGYLAGHKFRDMTHAMIPFNEPLSFILLMVTLMPLFMEAFFPSIEFVDPFDLSVVYAYLGFWVGYLIGYLQFSSDLLYVTVHDMVQRTQETEPIVRYTNSRGQQCWQPQSFKEISKTVFLGNHNPLTLTGNVNRTRHIRFRTEFITQEADAVDVAGLESNVIEVDKTILGHTFKMTRESRRYTPSPNATESKQEWVVKAMMYEDVFKEYSEQQMRAAEARAKLQGAQIKGGAMILNELGDKTPADLLLEAYSEEFEEFLENRDLKKNVKKAVQEDVRESMEVV